MTVYHVGINKKMDHKLTLGGRLKIYSGIFNVESTNNNGYFTTRDSPNGPNYYRHFADNLDIRVNTSGYASLKDNNKTVEEATADLLKRSFFGGNIGVGVDFGATYKIEDKITVTGSVQDLGMMFHKKTWKIISIMAVTKPMDWNPCSPIPHPVVLQFRIGIYLKMRWMLI